MEKLNGTFFRWAAAGLLSVSSLLAGALLGGSFGAARVASAQVLHANEPTHADQRVWNGRVEARLINMESQLEAMSEMRDSLIRIEAWIEREER